MVLNLKNNNVPFLNRLVQTPVSAIDFKELMKSHSPLLLTLARNPSSFASCGLRFLSFSRTTLTSASTQYKNFRIFESLLPTSGKVQSSPKSSSMTGSGMFAGRDCEVMSLWDVDGSKRSLARPRCRESVLEDMVVEIGGREWNAGTVQELIKLNAFMHNGRGRVARGCVLVYCIRASQANQWLIDGRVTLTHASPLNRRDTLNMMCLTASNPLIPIPLLPLQPE